MTQAESESEFSQEEINLLLNGPIWKAIASMSVPMVLNALAISAATFVDAYVAGKLGVDELAAVGIGGQVWFGLIIMAIAVSSGANALVARFCGASDWTQAREAARQSIFVALLFGLVSALVGFLGCDIFLKSLGATENVALLGASYLKIQFIAQIPLTLLWVCHSIFRAKGDAKIPTFIMALVTVSVVILDFALCLWPFKLGIVGVGLSWLIASTLGTLLMFLALKNSDLAPALEISREKPFRVSYAWAQRILRIGLPTCLQDLFWVGGNFGLFLIFARSSNPTALQAAWAVGLRVEDVLAGLPIFALSMGVATVVAQNLGAGKLERAKKVGWQAAAYGAALMTLVGALMFCGSGLMAKLMTDDPLIEKYAREYLQVLGISQPFNAVWLILFGAMEGAGYTKIPMYFFFVCVVLVRLGLAYFLTFGLALGALGAWLAIALTSVVGFSIAIIWFKRGSWLHHQV